MRANAKAVQWWLGICGSLLLTFSLTHAQASRELPALVFDNFSPDIRTSIQKAYEKAKAKPSDSELVGRLGMTLHTYEQHEAAALFYERATQLAPQEFRWFYYLGIAQSAIGKHSEASSAFKSAEALQSDHLLVQLRCADSLLALGQLDESQSRYEIVRKKNAEVAQAHYGLGRIAFARKNTAMAIAHLQKALLIFPQFGAAHYALGVALRDAGQLSEAQVHLGLSQQHKYLRPRLDDPLVEALAELNESASSRLKRGAAFSDTGNLPQAIAEHLRALEINPQLTQAHVNLIQLYGRSGQADQAERHYQAALKIDPNLADCHYNYGVLLAAQNRFREATAAFQRTLQLNPLHAEAHYNLGGLLETESKLDDAAIHYQQAITNKPDHRFAHFQLGRILVHQEKLSEAITHFQRTLQPQDEETARFTYALGATYVRAGERQKAIEYLRQALQIAKAFGQTQLISSLEKDLLTLEANAGQKP